MARRAAGGREKASPNPELPPDSEEAIALRFIDLRRDDLRHVATWKTWMVWDGNVWRRDHTQSVLAGIRTQLRAAADTVAQQEKAKPSRIIGVASARAARGVERLASADPRVAAPADIWDRHRDLLATPGGVVRLASAKLQPSEPRDYLTLQTRFAPAETDGCPTWLAFIDTITAGDRDLAAFLQRVAGYCLTGSVEEHKLFLLLGPGRNGKSVFTATLAAVLGDYAVTAPIDLLTESRGERHPTDLAALCGARLVVANETEASRPWAAARVKQLTGGDAITARRMRQDYSTYQPQFKLLVTGNHLPCLPPDPALAARLMVIPFAVTIPADRQDKRLGEKLLSEGPGILRWCIDGALAWRRIGLAPPAVVQTASAGFAAESDMFALWLSTRCEAGPTYKHGATSLREDFNAWSSRRSQPPVSEKAFAANMRLRGFAPARLSGGRAAFTGVRLKPLTSQE